MRNYNCAISIKDKIDVWKFLIHAKVLHLLIVTAFLSSPIEIKILAILLGIIRHFW